MRFRATYASLLTAILLFLSSAASKCEIECDLTSMGSSCHAAARTAHAQHASLPGMRGMHGMPEMAGAAANSGEAEVGAVVSHSAPCRAHACAQQPVVIAEQKAVVAHSLFSVGAVLDQAFQTAPEPTMDRLSGRGPPDLRPATPVSFRTTLRV